jgi:hypothetical protein
MSESLANPDIINIQPFAVSKDVVKVKISITSLEFNTKAVFGVDSYLANGGIFKHDDVIMEGEAYALWNNDDNYAINFVLAKLGYVRA